MTDIAETLKHRRPSLSDSSITTYSSILRNLFKKIFPDQNLDLKKFDDTEKILDFLHDVPPSRRKTILSALVVLTGNTKYKESMMSDISEYQNLISTQEKSQNQKEHWIHYDEVMTKLKELEDNAKLLYRKKNLTMSDMQQIQNYIILALLSGKYVAPRRSLDYVCMKVRNSKKDTDNYIDGKKFIFNRYKTRKFSGVQEIDIPPALKKILDKWIASNLHCEWLLFDNNSEPLTSVKLAQRLNRIFGSKLSTNALRHSYLQKLYGNTVDLNDKISATMKAMGSSRSMLQNYVKRDSDSD